MIINRIISIALTVLFFSCKQGNREQQVVLKINDFEVTQYELQKQARRELEHTNKNEVTLEKFKQDFINRNLIIADAYYKQYDSISEIIRNVNAISDIMMVQQDGYLWNTNVLPKIKQRINITPERLQKRGKVFYFDVIQITDTDSLFEVYDTSINTLNNFKKIKTLCEKHSFLTCSFETLQWPFNFYYPIADTLFNMTENSLSELLYSNGSHYYFYLHSIENVNVTKDDKELLSYLLLGIQENIATETKKHEMMEKGEPKIYKQTVKAILEHVNTGYQLESYPFNDTLISFKLNNKTQYKLFNDLMEPRRYFPFVQAINTKEDLETNAMQCYFSAYLKNEAQQLGLYTNEVFLLDRKNYKNLLMYDYYVENEVSVDIVIDSSDVIEYYENHPLLFTESKYIYANCFFFKTKEDADKSWGILSDFYRNNSTDMVLTSDEVPSLQYTLLNYKIDKEGYTDFIPEDIYKIKNLTPGYVSYSVSFKDSYALIVDIREEGEYMIDLTDVYQGIRAELFDKEKERRIKLKAESLKSQYPIVIDKIDIKSL